MVHAPRSRSLAESSDEELTTLIRSSDVRALDELASRHLVALQTQATRILADDCAAEDVALQVLEWVWAHRADWKPLRVRPFLVRKARWLALNELRRREASARREQAYAACALPHPEWPVDSAARAELGRSLLSAIACLPYRQRQAFLLRYLGGRPYGEVGGAMGVSPRAAEHYVALATEKLTASLTDEAKDWLGWDRPSPPASDKAS